MNLRETTRDILSQVEQLTGYLVEVIEDDNLQIQVGFECPMQGRRGLDLNKSEPNYTLRTLPGEYSALNVVAIMYAAFQQFAPGTDVGIDLAREYDMAQGMKG